MNTFPALRAPRGSSRLSCHSMNEVISKAGSSLVWRLKDHNKEYNDSVSARWNEVDEVLESGPGLIDFLPTDAILHSQWLDVCQTAAPSHK